MRIETKDADGHANGYLVPLWNANDMPDLRPDQVYLTVVAPRTRKGPHLHNVRRGMFICVRGNVRIVTQYRTLVGNVNRIGYRTEETGEDNQYRRVMVKPGQAAAIYNWGDEDAFVLNMPSPAWSAAEPDDQPVDQWRDPDAWRLFLAQGGGFVKGDVGAGETNATA